MRAREGQPWCRLSFFFLFLLLFFISLAPVSTPGGLVFFLETCDTIRGPVPVKGDYFGLLFAWTFAAEGRRRWQYAGQELNTLHKLRRDPPNERRVGVGGGEGTVEDGAGLVGI